MQGVPPILSSPNQNQGGQMKTSNLQKKSKPLATHILKRRSLNTSKRTCKGNRSFEGLTFPDNFLAIFGYRRARV